MRRSRLTDPLKKPQFRRLATSYGVNELGDWMGIVALSVLVFDRTGSAMATAALFLGTRFLPALVAPILVAKVEQPPPRFALPVVYCGEAAAFGALALLAGDGFFLAGVVALAIVDGALALTGRALTRAVVAALLEPSGELRAGNAMLNVAFTGSAALGPGIAGLIVAGFGVQTALLLDAASFYAIAWILLTAGPLPHAEPEPGRVRERFRAGIAYIRERPTLRRLLIGQGAAFVFFAAVIPIEVIYAKETLDAGDSGYGLLLASWGVGMVLGSIVFARARRAPLALLLFFSTIAVGLGYLGLAAAPTLALACGASIVGGAGNGVQWVSAISAVQELTVAGMQARVMSVLESIGAAMPGVGYLLGGLIAAATSPRTTFLFAGLGVLAIVSLAAAIMGRKWPESREKADGNAVDAEVEIMVELIPVGGTLPTRTRSNSEVVT
ncbi:MAG TPA: MFS transporter [Solirubrobacterales bacterium]|nr:MFS transporter [Solirubrobacterales bacterium]